ncbi:CynX/NimT family MFS transporter [Thermoproteota archaeon]
MLRGGTNERWFMLSLGWLTYFSFGLINTAVAPLVTNIMNELSIDYTQMGVIMGAWQLVYIFSAQPLGLLTDRLGVYRSLLLGTIIISISSLLRGIAGGFWGLFASVAIFGLGGPLISIGTPKLVSIWFRGEERGTASGINASGSILGSMVALGLTNSQILPLLGSWRRVFFLYGIVGLTSVFLWFFLGKTKTPTEGGDHSDTAMGSPQNFNYFSLLKHRGIWILVWVGVVFFLSTHALKNWMPKILEIKGYSPRDAGYATSLVSLMGLLGNLTVPRLSNSLSSKRLMITFVLLVSGASIFVIGVGQGSVLWVGLLLFGYASYSIMPLLTLTLMDIPFIGSERMGVAGGLLFSIGEIGGFMGPFLMGYLKDITDSFISGFLLLTLANIVAISLIQFFKSESAE